MGAFDQISDVTVVRLAGIEAVEALMMWGRWLRQGSGLGKSPGLEGKFRSNRCTICYEQEDPCDACKRSAVSGGLIDERLAMAVERSVTYGTMRISAGGGRNRITNGCTDKEQALLIAHYRGIRGKDGGWMASDPRILCRQLGLRPAEYEQTVAKVTQQVWNRAKKRING